jgi:hypothetical protein
MKEFFNMSPSGILQARLCYGMLHPIYESIRDPPSTPMQPMACCIVEMPSHPFYAMVQYVLLIVYTCMYYAIRIIFVCTHRKGKVMLTKDVLRIPVVVNI